MSLIPDETIEQVRDAADIVEIIGEHVDLRRTGTDYRGPCPFHGGTHRNLAVIPRKQMYYCFVCHEGGDVFTFLMKRFGMEYPQAVREVGSRVGIEIAERSTGGPDPNEPLYTAVSVAAEWYARQLRESAEAEPARRYLVERGFTLEQLLPYGLGFAPRGGAFLDAMATHGVADETLLEAGLAVRRDDGSVRPRFWGRLLFPIHDLRARVVGFGGRILGHGEPKYLNSPESRIFHKGRLLYNLHAAKLAIRRDGRAIVVEGYFDVIRLLETGVENVVAGQGTSFSAEQAALLRRYTPEIVLCYDSDAAGMRAAFRAADELLRAGARVLIATPPAGEDPDSLAREGGKAALESLLDDAIDVLERKLQLLERKGWMGDLSGRRRALDRLLPTLRAPADPVTRDLYASRAAEALGVGVESIRREVDGGRRRSEGRQSGRAPAFDPDPTVGRPAAGHNAERRLLEVMVHEPEWRSRILDTLPDSAAFTAAEQQVVDLLRVAPPDVPVSALFDRLDPPARALLTGLLAQPWAGDLDIGAIVIGALDRIEGRKLDTAITERQRRLPLVPIGEEKDALVREIRDLTEQKRRLRRPSRSPS